MLKSLPPTHAEATHAEASLRQFNDYYLDYIAPRLVDVLGQALGDPTCCIGRHHVHTKPVSAKLLVALITSAPIRVEDPMLENNGDVPSADSVTAFLEMVVDATPRTFESIAEGRDALAPLMSLLLVD
jgi:hypothetical protein